MTAEVAILNKSAIALAADSAITLSLGSDQQKVFDSEDKLFELTLKNPIGVMINSNMHFMEAPLPVLIKRYRSICPDFDWVSDAGHEFLRYLQEFGSTAPEGTIQRGVAGTLLPILHVVKKRAEEKVFERMLTPPEGDVDFSAYFSGLRATLLTEQIATMRRVIEGLEETDAIGEVADDAGLTERIIAEVIAEVFPDGEAAHLEALRALSDAILTRRVRHSPHTGVIVAGFGHQELFPTLVSFEVYGMIRGQLRYFKTNDVDVRRSGIKAKVIPFAQREMVERFLYGLDDEIERKIEGFCRQAVPSIREKTLETLVMDDADRAAMERDMQEAESAFLDGLREKTFDVIREQSEREIEDMVEFMPKSEMARMAEALVNLTSIKRRVTRGMETVGGPIDCAVISQADGFVWVKRKHYFPPELNNRYFARMRGRVSKTEEA